MASQSHILAGDVGATKTILALFRVENGQLVQKAEQTFFSPEHTGVEEILKHFWQRHPVRLAHLCFGVAGPVVGAKAKLPNLDWKDGVAAEALSRTVENVPTTLLNDLEATGYGLRLLSPGQFVVLNRGRAAAQANAALIAAGTGLGESILFWDGEQHRPSASEGGHCDFAPRTLLELEFLQYALAQLGHVSYDRVVSGSGLHLLYRFLRDTGRGQEPPGLGGKLTGDDPAAVIAEAALTEKVPLCQQALRMFVGIYGAEAGNLALKALARAGVYVGGGIAPKVLPVLTGGEFMRAFTDKGRMASLMAEIPVQVVLEPRTALLGAAYYAAREAGWRVDTEGVARGG
jgi:glucokinase